jgi:hypothetical protein
MHLSLWPGLEKQQPTRNASRERSVFPPLQAQAHGRQIASVTFANPARLIVPVRNNVRDAQPTNFDARIFLMRNLKVLAMASAVGISLLAPDLAEAQQRRNPNVYYSPGRPSAGLRVLPPAPPRVGYIQRGQQTWSNYGQPAWKNYGKPIWDGTRGSRAALSAAQCASENMWGCAKTAWGVAGVMTDYEVRAYRAARRRMGY